MEVRTYRAKSLQQALQLVRRDLGPDAAVLHTREIRGGLLGWLSHPEIEVMASVDVDIPSRFAALNRTDESRRETPQYVSSVEEFEQGGDADWPQDWDAADRTDAPLPAHQQDFRQKFREDLRGQIDNLQSMVEDLCRQSGTGNGTPIDRSQGPAALLADLLAGDVPEDLARELVDKVRSRVAAEDLNDVPLLKARLARCLEDEIHCSGPIRVAAGRQRLVALVGPTGVGKTTTIAKLAAHFHLREKRRVGLITVDTYRIAAVDQLQTYADIIDLPMEVVSTPREMRAALAKLSDLELILMDTAGRSPSDEVRLQELRFLLTEARPDEVHLVLSCVANPSSIRKAAEQFTNIGATALLLTKLDEAMGLGGLMPVLHDGRLPVSYVTMGQNVPDDIAPADSRKLAWRMLGLEGVE